MVKVSASMKLNTNKKDAKCPLCSRGNTTLWLNITKSNFILLRCSDCSLIFQSSSSLRDEKKYDLGYYDYWALESFAEAVGWMKVNTAFAYLKLLHQKLALEKGTLLDVGCAYGYMLEAARFLGYEAYGVEISPAAEYARSLGFEVFKGDFMETSFEKGFFDVVTMVDVLEHFPDPTIALKRINEILTKDGTIFIVTPNISSFSRRILNERWFHFKDEHLYYYSPTSMRILLEMTDLRPLYIGQGFKYLSYQYIVGHFKKYSDGGIAETLRLIGKLLPREIVTLPLKFPTEMICIARKNR